MLIMGTCISQHDYSKTSVVQTRMARLTLLILNPKKYFNNTRYPFIYDRLGNMALFYIQVVCPV